MRHVLLFLAVLPAPAAAQTVEPGNWDVRSTAVDLTVPGAPSFILRMMRGKSRTEHKCLTPDQAKAGIAALFVPKPEAKCTVERAAFADGRIAHVMTCPQKNGAPMRIVHEGTYGASGFAATMTMTGQTQKGAMRIVAARRGARTGPMCRK